MLFIQAAQTKCRNTNKTKKQTTQSKQHFLLLHSHFVFEKKPGGADGELGPAGRQQSIKVTEGDDTTWGEKYNYNNSCDRTTSSFPTVRQVTGSDAGNCREVQIILTFGASCSTVR